jgi:hypothetical protein
MTVFIQLSNLIPWNVIIFLFLEIELPNSTKKGPSNPLPKDPTKHTPSLSSNDHTLLKSCGTCNKLGYLFALGTVNFCNPREQRSMRLASCNIQLWADRGIRPCHHEIVGSNSLHWRDVLNCKLLPTPHPSTPPCLHIGSYSLRHNHSGKTIVFCLQS